jgi:signal transduction histidine kinase
VLLVDRNADRRTQTQAWLERAGHQVSVASDAESALRSFARAGADLVLLDEEHVAICRRLRELPEGDRSAIALLASDEAIQRLAFDCGADDCLDKSTEQNRLLLRVQSLLRLEQRRSEHARAVESLRNERAAWDELLRQRDENIALLVHDMKNPLAGVLSNAEFLASSDGLDDDQRGCADDILYGSRRLHRMVMSMLDVSQSEHGALQPTAASLELTEFIATVRVNVAPKLRDKSLTLTVVLPSEPVRFEVDRDMLARMLLNLLDNAVRHAPVGSSVGLEVQAEGDAIELRVSDAGPSVPVAERTRLFESYVQNDNAGRIRARRGLGLSSSRAVAEAHGGEIWVEDNNAEGATFCVRLPR